MKKISCNIVRDVLPLYLDNVVSDDTKEMVEEHLKICESCRKEADLLQQDVVVPTIKSIQLSEAKMLKSLKARINRKKITISLVSVILAVTAVVSLGFALAFSKSYIPYSNTQFEIVDMNGKIYACYHGNCFGGSVSHDPISVEVDGKQKNFVIFYTYRTPLDSITSYFENRPSNNEQLIHLGNADEIDAIYYGEFDPRDPGTKISANIPQAELIWGE